MDAAQISGMVTTRFAAARAWRQQYFFGGASLEDWFFRTYNMYNGIHHPVEVQREKRRSGLDITQLGYFPFGRLKVDAARVYVDGTYSHAISAPFTLEPRKNPELSASQNAQVTSDVARLLSEMLGAGGLDYADIWSPTNKTPKSPAVEKWLKNAKENAVVTYGEKARLVAQEACTYRADYIADQLNQGAWRDAWNIITHNLMAEPYTAMCARELKTISTRQWTGNSVKTVQKTVPSFRAIDPRHLYLASDCTNAQDGQGVTELTIRSRSDLLGMIGQEGIDQDGLQRALIKLATTQTEATNWLKLTDVLAGQETHSVIHQGLFSGRELANCGKTGYREDEYYNVSVEVCQNELLRFDVLPIENNTRNYYTAQHSKTNAGFAGESILTKLHDIQNQLNIAVILRDRNYAMSSGPTLFLDASKLDRPQDTRMMPYAMNLLAVDARTGGANPIQQIEVAAHYSQMDAHIESLKRQGDEISGVVSGLSGLGRSGIARTTLGGAVLDQTNGERMVNACVLNLDRQMIEPMIEALDADNILSKAIPKQYVRGDVIVIGRGINGLKEAELRGRLVTEALPLAMQANQAGKIPDETLDGALKTYFDSKGIDTSAIQSVASKREISQLNPKQTSDGRTYNPQQSMTGVANGT